MMSYRNQCEAAAAQCANTEQQPDHNALIEEIVMANAIYSADWCFCPCPSFCLRSVAI